MKSWIEKPYLSHKFVRGDGPGNYWGSIQSYETKVPRINKYGTLYAKKLLDDGKMPRKTNKGYPFPIAESEICLLGAELVVDNRVVYDGAMLYRSCVGEQAIMFGWIAWERTDYAMKAAREVIKHTDFRLDKNLETDFLSNIDQELMKTPVAFNVLCPLADEHRIAEARSLASIVVPGMLRLFSDKRNGNVMNIKLTD